jgi:DNA-binding transcriptional MerR regulator
MSKPLRIGALSKATGRSIHAIRWYERQELIPGVERDRSGRRVYAPAHVGWLDFLARLRLSGMSIARMRGYAQLVMAGRRSLSERRNLLRDHRAALVDRLAALSAALEMIDRKIEHYEEWERTGVRPAWPPSDSQTEAPPNPAPPLTQPAA